MKNVLILCHDYPPLNSIGAQRPESWFNYFHEFNLYPIIITKQWADLSSSQIQSSDDTSRSINGIEDSKNGRIFRVNLKYDTLKSCGSKTTAIPALFIRKVSSFLEFFLSHFFIFFDSKANLYFEAEKVMKESKIDLIIATGEPFILFKYASRLSAKFNIPWVADYRDGWSTRQDLNELGLFRRLSFRYYFRRIEKKYINSASCIFTAAPPYKKALQEIFISKQIEVIYNGFSTGLVNPIVRTSSDKKRLTIAYAGSLYPYQKLEMFLKGLEMAVEKINDFRFMVYFYGANFNPKDRKRILSFEKSINPWIQVTDRLPHPIVLKKLLDADILLLLANKKQDWLYAKVFEYLALNRKIMLVENDKGILEKLLLKHSDGIICDNHVDVYQAIKESHECVMNGRPLDTASHNIEMYSRKQQARKFASFIQEIST